MGGRGSVELAKIGEALKTERANRGLTLADVHEATKISIQNLAALEEERFESFANKVYARAFLRDYANFLGLDSGKLLEQYEEEWGRPAVPPEPVEKRRLPALAIIGALVVLIAGGAYYLFTEQTDSTAPVRTSSRPSSKPKPIETGPPLPPRPKPPPEAQKNTTPETLKVKIGAFQPSWIRVDLDGKTAYQGTLRPGQSSQWEAREILRLRTGNAGGLQITINGIRQPALGASGQIAERVWKRSMLAQSGRPAQ